MIRGTRRWLIRLLAGVAGLPGIAVADDLFFGRKLKSRCCLPEHEYANGGFGNPVTGRSLRPIPTVADAAVAVAGRTETTKRRVFQVRPGTLAVDHCSVSGISITLAPDGEWQLSCTATQNPADIPFAQRAQFEKFIRNEFRLQIRPVLLNSSNADDNTSLGPAELRICEDQQFWVQKGETRKVALQGTSPELTRYYADIEQVTVHFSIR